MGVTKNDLFTQRQNEMATVAKGLAHPERVAIIEYLLASDQCINGQLVEKLGLTQATISQHLREIKDSGIIQGNIEGASVWYCIHPQRWKKSQEILNTLFESYQAQACENNC